MLITAGSVEHLVAFYALGVFTGFTLAGFGMAKHAYVHRLGAWKAKFVINGLSGSVSFIVVIIFSIVKFSEGAWLVLVTAPIMVVSFLRLRRQYTKEQSALDVKREQDTSLQKMAICRVN